MQNETLPNLKKSVYLELDKLFSLCDSQPNEWQRKTIVDIFVKTVASKYSTFGDKGADLRTATPWKLVKEEFNNEKITLVLFFTRLIKEIIR
jgi:hypothetical protein